jgi:ATP-dependent Clp protease ATP-binding subunit ClpB
MSEFSDAEAISRLLGNPNDQKGILGHLLEKTGQSGTFLFDEIEKANRSVLDLLLQVLDASRITLFDKSVMSFSNYYVVCTSNIGTAELRSYQRHPLRRKDALSPKRWNNTKSRVFGRFSKRVVFESLSFKNSKEICQPWWKKN